MVQRRSGGTSGERTNDKGKEEGGWVSKRGKRNLSGGGGRSRRLQGKEKQKTGWKVCRGCWGGDRKRVPERECRAGKVNRGWDNPASRHNRQSPYYIKPAFARNFLKRRLFFFFFLCSSPWARGPFQDLDPSRKAATELFPPSFCSNSASRPFFFKMVTHFKCGFEVVSVRRRPVQIVFCAVWEAPPVERVISFCKGAQQWGKTHCTT